MDEFPPLQWDYVSERAFLHMNQTLTVDIGGTKCAAAITGDDGVVVLESWPTQGSLENLLLVEQFYAKHSGDPLLSVNAVGVCFGGPVDFEHSTVKRSVHVSGWEGFNFEDWARVAFNLPVAVDNDGNIGALAEFARGDHAASDLIYVTVSTGIGAGVISGGKLLRGISNDAGELGHIRVSDDPRLCECGRAGCFERLCSGYWLEQDYGKPAADLLADNDFLVEYTRTFARGLATAVLLYNPGVVVLGGGVSRVGTRLTDSLSDSLRRELASWGHLTPRITTTNFDSAGVHRGARELTRELFR
ncbi:MAG: hypothetical protein RLZZ587_807 [Actinomycetota bacterium]|jgi:glucokinase